MMDFNQMKPPGSHFLILLFSTNAKRVPALLEVDTARVLDPGTL